MQFYLRNNFDTIANNHKYIQKILELHINTCQTIRFESMSSRKIYAVSFIISMLVKKDANFICHGGNKYLCRRCLTNLGMKFDKETWFS